MKRNKIIKKLVKKLNSLKCKCKTNLCRCKTLNFKFEINDKRKFYAYRFNVDKK